MPGRTKPMDNMSKEISISMTQVACEPKLRPVVRSFMHPWVAIGCAVVYNARAVHAFNAGVTCRQCRVCQMSDNLSIDLLFMFSKMYHFSEIEYIDSKATVSFFCKCYTLYWAKKNQEMCPLDF